MAGLFEIFKRARACGPKTCMPGPIKDSVHAWSVQGGLAGTLQRSEEVCCHVGKKGKARHMGLASGRGNSQRRRPAQ
jgi:hypothetical protein